MASSAARSLDEIAHVDLSGLGPIRAALARA